MGADLQAWRQFFAPYADIVLIANSAEVDMDALDRDFGPETLFVFFNKVYKVLEGRFSRPAILISRSGMMGANIVHRREAAQVLGHFDPASFRGVVNIIIGNDERFSTAEEFGTPHVAHLDLDPLLSPFYPPQMVPTTGFALSIWLEKLGLQARITLAGFSSKRSEKWKVFDIHDWTFEQVVLRLMRRNGQIQMLGADSENHFTLLRTHFPQFSERDIAEVTDEVLSERLSHVSATVDRLMSVTKPLRYLGDRLRQLRPKTRKQKYVAQHQKEQNGAGGA